MASYNVPQSVEPSKPCQDTQLSVVTQQDEADEPIIITETCPICQEEFDPQILSAHIQYCKWEMEDQADTFMDDELTLADTIMDDGLTPGTEDRASDASYIQSSDDDDYTRPKRVKCLTKEEKIIEGLTTGKDAPLEVKEGGIAGRGVFATARIEKGSWLCEYKASKVFPKSEKRAVEEQYERNGEGSYVVESTYPIPDLGIMCWDATRRFHQLGRYLNHAQRPNATITAPKWARGQWRIGFVSCRGINEGDEVVWDYGVRGERWSGCRLVDGVVTGQKGTSMEPGNEEGQGGNEETKQDNEQMQQGSGQMEPEEPTQQAHAHAPQRRRKLCVCPLCNAGPLQKLSNHLAQVHHLNPEERAKFLGEKRIFAARPKPKQAVRSSQRKLTACFGFGAPVDSDIIIIEDAPSPPSPQSPPTPPSSPPHPPVTHSTPGPSEAPPRPASGPPHPSVTPSTPGPSVASCSNPASSGRGSTRRAGQHALTEPFLVTLNEYLGSRLGGRKDPVQRKEISVDVSKYLYFANDSACDPNSLLSRSKVHEYIKFVEGEGVGPSGLLSKIRRIELAIECLCFEATDSSMETERRVKRDEVVALFEKLRTSLKREKGQRQRKNLTDFSHHVPGLGQVTKFLTDKSLSDFLKETGDLAQSGETISAEKLKSAMVVVAGRLLLRNGQRPGVVTGMTMGEYRKPSEPTPGTHVYLVNEHKGARPARVVATGEAVKEMHLWVHHLRPLYVQEECPYVFCTQSGQKLTKLSQMVTEVCKKFSIDIPPATVVRKAIATAGGELGESEKVALAHSMSHTKATADQYYRAYGEAKSLQGFDTVGKILDIPLTKKRQRFTPAQVKKIEDHFAQEIGAKVIPSGEAMDRFLEENRELFPGRKRGDIYSKVRNIVGRDQLK